MSDQSPNYSMTVAEAVAYINQTLEYAYPSITVLGELSAFNISKGQWVYADIKDSEAKMRMFGTKFQLPGPLKDGMMIEVTGEPRLHPQFGFSLQIRSVRVVGEGHIKKAQALLQAKLTQEGLFALERKRIVPSPPESVGLVASVESAAYTDFIKIARSRWQGVEIRVRNVAVQGEQAVGSIVSALQQFNQESNPVDVLVIIRGGGSADDLAAFSTEQVTRAVAASRIPTVAAIGHEIDVSLTELASDLHASTPSNAAELLFPDKKAYSRHLKSAKQQIDAAVMARIVDKTVWLNENQTVLTSAVERELVRKHESLRLADALLESAHPNATLKRGYALVRVGDRIISSASKLHVGQNLTITMQMGSVGAEVKSISDN